MAILSALKRRFSQVFAGNQEIHEDEDVEQTQATADSSDSHVANSITFVEGPDGPSRTEGDVGITEQGVLQDPEGDTVAGKLKLENDTQDSNTGSLTFSQAIDDEEWANGLCGEDIEAAFERPIRQVESNCRQESEAQTSLVAHPEDDPQGSSASTSRTSLKRGPEPGNQNSTQRLLKRLKVIHQSALETRPTWRSTSPTPSQNTQKSAYPFGLNVIADFSYLNDDPKIAWGIKWEFSRLASQRPVTVSDALLADLRGSHVDIAPKLRQLIRDHAQKRDRTTSDQPQPWSQPSRELAVTAPWEELDREDQAWERGNDEGIGLKTEDGWYGGKVQFSTTLDWDEKKKRFRVHLNAPTTGKSTHFGRAFHSRSCITMRITKSALKQGKLKDYLKACHKFFGCSFYVLDASTEKVTLVDAKARRPNHDPSTEKLDEDFGLQWMINYLNPMEINHQQSVSKWRARFQLYFSDTVPGYRVEPGRVLEQEDWELPHDGEKCPAEKVLTDGCGRISLSALKSIQSNLRLGQAVSAVQLRFFGAKGMALAMLPSPYEPEEEGDIILRPSQRKIHMDTRYVTDEAKLTIDIVRPAKISTPARLSAESIQIMSHNGVPSRVFLELQKKSFEEDFSALVDWPEDKPLVKLALAVAQTQNVVGSRRARLARGMARARGLSAQSWDEVDEGQGDVGTEADQRSAAWWPDDVSGCPSSLAETCLVNLQAGFRPESLPYIKSKLRNLLDETLGRYVDKFKITVPYALTGTLVPDPLGLLKPDEISISLSEPMDIAGKKILRNPAKQETDVRKVKIVNCPRLHQLKDVIVVSVRSLDRSLASRLGGGDYDGDKAQVILEEALVKPFRNAPTDAALQVPESVKDAFKCDNGSVANLLMEKQRNEAEFTARLSEILLLPINIYPGEYSIFHELAVYMHGLGHQEAIRVGYMFTEGLDGSKTGKSVKAEIQRADAQRYRRFGRVTWNRGREYMKKAESSEHNNFAQHPIPRDQKLGPFVMDKLREAGELLHREILQRFDDRIKRDTKWKSAQTEVVRQWARAGRLELKQKECDISQKEAIEALRFLINAMDVDSSDVTRDIRPLDHWMQAISRAIALVVKRGSGLYAADLINIYQAIVPIAEKHFAIAGVKTFNALDIVSRQDALRKLSVEFAEAVPLDDLLTPLSSLELALLKASCAYSLSRNHVRVTPQFAFSVATRGLCHLKALSGPCQTVSQEFIDGMSLHSGYVEDFE